ncbi:FAD-binding oxidoreductase [Micromonospora sp. NPDC018662]|uniref:FAD-binding oxidoreductase n=1 Tax=Micromonospora sp. NPDC018662 TaxID=3364238 RepID=UPI0037A06948
MSGPARIATGDPRYEDFVVRGDNARFPPRPDAFVLARSTEDVVRAVQDAVRAGHRVAVRSGGHCYEDFVADPTVRVVIDLAALDRVEFDAERQAFAVGPGVRLMDLYRALYLGWGVTVPGGASELVGIGGHLLGGGYGPLSRRFGACSDHLYAVEVVVVDADGRARAVVATRDPADPNHDLWWAHTGAGGGNFGVVTRYWLRSPGAEGEPGDLLPRPPASVLASSTVFPREGLTREALRALVGGHGRWHERNSAPDSPYAGLFSGLVLFAVAPQDDPGIGAILFNHLDGTGADAEELLARAVREMTGDVDAPRYDLPVERAPWLATMVKLARAQDGESGRHKIKSAYLRRGYTDAQIDTIHDHLWGDGHAFSSATISLQSYGCAANAVAPDATATAQRDSVLRALYLTSWQDPATDEANLDWTRRLYRDVYAATGGVPLPDERNDGCYINFPDVDIADPRWNTSGVPWQYLYFKENHPRLQQIKKRWDPLTVFRHALSVQ